MRNDTTGIHVALKDIGISTQTIDTFLDACTTAVIETNDGSSDSHGQIHNFTNFLGVCFTERSTNDCEILRECVHDTTIDTTMSNDYSIARILLILHMEFVTSMSLELIQFGKCPSIKQQFQTFSGGQTPFSVLSINSFLSSTLQSFDLFGTKAIQKTTLDNGWIRCEFPSRCRSGRGDECGRVKQCPRRLVVVVVLQRRRPPGTANAFNRFGSSSERRSETT